MRYDRRYTRVLGIITNPVIPRLSNGGPALCHFCQRTISFAGGFLQHLQKTVERSARYAVLRGATCPKGCVASVYKIKAKARTISRCAKCRCEWSPTSNSEHRQHKVPVEVREAIKRETSSGAWGEIGRAAKKYGVSYRTAWRLAGKVSEARLSHAKRARRHDRAPGRRQAASEEEDSVARLRPALQEKA